MVAGDLQVGDFADNIVGDVAALASAAGFAFYAAIVRSAPERDWSPVLPGYGVLMIVICATVTIADSNTLVPPGARTSGWPSCTGRCSSSAAR